jgi:very-short-patch-repair endonuclease
MPFDISAQIEAWRTLLLDTTKRNRLINFKTGRGGGVALVHPDPGELWHRLLVADSALTFPWRRDLIDLPNEAGQPGQDDAAKLAVFDPTEPPDPDQAQDVLEQCRHSPRVSPGHLLTDLPDPELARRLTRLALNARDSLTEQGVTTLFVAFGFLRWFESADSQAEIRSPLLLVPVRLEREAVDAPWRLAAGDEEILPNHTLAQLLAAEFRLSLPAWDEEAADPGDPGWRTGYFGEVERSVRHHPRWEVLDEAALGTFAFQKLAMWEDLGRNRERIGQHDLCRAIAGDSGVALRCPANLPRADELDQRIDPRETHHILDADSSQHEAIAAAVRGASLVLDGPPGTGKSQTIANVIAESLAAGKTVLFVSEKAAALEVVQRRLQDRGLGDFCLACHSHKANKREVVAELGRCLELGREAQPDVRDELARLAEARARLNDYVHALHAVRQPLGMSVFQAHAELARLAGLAGASRCPVPEVSHRDAAYLRGVTDLLAGLPACQAVIEDRGRHPWRGCRAPVYSLTLRDDIWHHFGRLGEGLGPVLDAAAALHRLGFVAGSPTRAQWLAAVGAARAVLACPPVPPTWVGASARPVAEAVIQLDRVSVAYRRGLAALPEFAPDALRQADAAALAGLAPPAAGAVPRLVPRPAETVSGQCRRLDRVIAALRDLHGQAVVVDQAAQRVTGLLQTPLPPVPVKSLRWLAELAGHIARMEPVRSAWWDAGRRKELQTVIARWQGETRAAQELRAELAARLSPEAFGPEGAAMAKRAGRFRWFLMRWLPGWWSVKARAAGWYADVPPATAALLDDLGKVAAYHRRVEYCRQVRERYAADLLPGADGGPDWDGTREALHSVDRLEQLGKVPTALQAVLTREAALDRPALAAAAQALAQEATQLRQGLEALAADYNLEELTDGAPHQIRRPAGDLAAWLAEQGAAVARHRATLERVSGLLAPGRDPPAAALPAQLAAVAELGRLRAQAAELSGRIWPGQPPASAEERDWSALRAGAEGLLRLLDTWRGALPSAVARAVSEPAVREQLADAVRRGEAGWSGACEESWKFLAGLFDLGQDVSTGITVERAPLADVRNWLAERAADADRLREWALFCEAERQLGQGGVLPVLHEVLAGQVRPSDAAAAFRARFLRLWLDAVYEQAPALRDFGTDAHERLIKRFRELDRRSIALGAARVRAFQLSRPDRPRAFSGEAPGSSELGTLLREVNKKRRHVPLRRLFAAIPGLLPRLKPCLMMSPLAVSTYLQSPDVQFDLVIFDEASQVRPHDAVCAIYRGRQLIVAGDQRQLPPTSFFDRVLEDAGPPAEADEGEGLQDYESVLDVCCTLGLPRRRLRWHYRSRREGLIAFANHHIYDNELVTFPSVHDVRGNPAVAFAYVPDGRWKPGPGGGFNAVEARRTAERVLAHFREHPDQSLGVIAFSLRQQMRILDELEQLRRANPELEGYFAEGRDEPFFVKNLENVQGDERDVIFLSIGYGPDETGRVAMRFGPLNREGGERRLNVAVTRARRGMTVVSSLRAQDIDITRTGARGARLLRAYLDYAERGPEALQSGITEAGDRGFDSPFEREVYEELSRHGLTVHPQVGCSGFRLDLAVVDPRAPGRYLLGVECDGAAYHSSATARDRDRLRQEVLESLGWRICRVWSTDWLRDRAAQIRRVLAALDQAQREGPGPAPGQPAAKPAGSLAVPRPSSAGKEAVNEPPAYESIEEVPEPLLRDLLVRALQTFGATEAPDLVKAASRQLGFERTGKRIQARLGECLEALVREGRIRRTADQRLQAPPAPRAVGL